MSREQLVKYETWIREIERRRDDIASKRTGYLRFFVGMLVASNLGFFWGVWFGVGSLLTGILCCLFGFYTVLYREGEYVDEIAWLRNVTDGLREEVEKNEREGATRP
jgi:hypothetical protein